MRPSWPRRSSRRRGRAACVAHPVEARLSRVNVPWGLSSKTTHVTHRPGSCGGGQRTGCCHHLHGSEGGNKGQRQLGGCRLHLGAKLSEGRKGSKVKVDDCLVMMGFDFPRISSQLLILCSCFFFFPARGSSGSQTARRSRIHLSGSFGEETRPKCSPALTFSGGRFFKVSRWRRQNFRASLVQISKPLPAVPEQTKK